MGKFLVLAKVQLRALLASFRVGGSRKKAVSGWTALALFCVGSVCLWGAFLLSLLISRLLSQNQELAMQVSLLLRENEELLAWRREEAREDEADFVCR